MDLTPEFISTVGFPIAAFLLVFWSNIKVISKNTEALNELKIEIARTKATQSHQLS